MSDALKKLEKKTADNLVKAFTEQLAKSGLIEQLMEFDTRIRELTNAQFELLAVAREVRLAHDRLEGVHRDHMGIMLDVQRQQQARAALEERARQQGYLDAMGYERNATWGMARLEAGYCPGLDKTMARCELKAKHEGDCKFPVDGKPIVDAKLHTSDWKGYKE